MILRRINLHTPSGFDAMYVFLTSSLELTYLPEKHILIASHDAVPLP